MIYEVEGDILLSRAQVIAQEVGINDQMNRGLARSLADRYPAMVSEFHQWCRQENPETGEIWLWEGKGNSRNNTRVVSLITRQGRDDDLLGSGRASQLALLGSLRALKKLATKQRFTSLALPKLTTGEGGLDWYDVRGMMYTQLGELLIPVYIYVNNLNGQLAFEPGF